MAGRENFIERTGHAPARQMLGIHGMHGAAEAADHDDAQGQRRQPSLAEIHHGMAFWFFRPMTSVMLAIAGFLWIEGDEVAAQWVGGTAAVPFLFDLGLAKYPRNAIRFTFPLLPIAPFIIPPPKYPAKRAKATKKKAH